MNDTIIQHDFSLEPDDNQRLANLCGPFDEHLRQIELRLGVEINNRGNVFRVIGEKAAVQSGERVLRMLYAATEDESLDARKIGTRLSEAGVDGISFTFFTARDVVRHPLVAKIVRAYEKAEDEAGEQGPGTGDRKSRNESR
jgi:phosphate starvation-inducible protein PhoH